MYQLLAQAVSCVTREMAFHDEVAGNTFDAQFFHGGNIGFHLLGVLFSIALSHAGRNKRGVYQSVIKNPARGVIVNSLDVI